MRKIFALSYGIAACVTGCFISVPASAQFPPQGMVADPLNPASATLTTISPAQVYKITDRYYYDCGKKKWVWVSREVSARGLSIFSSDVFVPIARPAEILPSNPIKEVGSGPPPGASFQAGDPRRAFNPTTGQNFVRRKDNWVDVKTGQVIAAPKLCPETAIAFPAPAPQPQVPEVGMLPGPGAPTGGAWHWDMNAGLGGNWNKISITTPFSGSTIHASGPSVSFTGTVTAPNGAYVTATMSTTNVVNDSFEERVGAGGRVDGTINSFIIGAGVPVFTTGRAGIGPYGGYYSWNTRLDGRLETPPLAAFTLLNSTWQSPVIGLAGYYQISDSMTLSAVLASMPAVRATWGAFDGRGTGWLANATLSTRLFGQYYIDTSVRWISQTASDTVGGVPIDSNAQSLEAVAAFKVRF